MPRVLSSYSTKDLAVWDSRGGRPHYCGHGRRGEPSSVFLSASDSFCQLWDMKITFSRFRSTDRMIMRLILLSIEVGALTTIVAAAELAISKLYPQCESRFVAPGVYRADG
jgi:hypothetical protein